MAPRRFAGLAASLCGTVALVVWLIAGVAGFGLPNIKNTDAAPIEDRREPLRSVDNELVDASQAAAMIKTGVPNADAGPAAAAVTGTDGSGSAEAIVEAALTDPLETPSSETPTVQIATAGMPDLVHTDPKEAVTSIETTDECLTEVCIDHYLWLAYHRTPKLDTVKEVEQRKVIVKRNGKQRTVIKELTKLVDEDFTWKDPKAAEQAGMSLMDYVIGGMDRGFKLKLYHALRAMDDAGLSPGITSAFRDDYRQSLASGLKAATDRSYHGGTFRGGYGHGLAADLVSVKGETRAERWISSENLWKWIDAHGEEFGIGRPYLDKDPAHVAPIDGKEYADHRRRANKQHARSEIKKGNRLAVRDEHGIAKRSKAAGSSKVRNI
jgi:hypothetical protein